MRAATVLLLCLLLAASSFAGEHNGDGLLAQLYCNPGYTLHNGRCYEFGTEFCLSGTICGPRTKCCGAACCSINSQCVGPGYCIPFGTQHCGGGRYCNPGSYCCSAGCCR